jgi:magnesium transporter
MKPLITVLPPRRRPSDLDLADALTRGTSAAVAAWLATTRDRQVVADQVAALTDAQVRALVRLLDRSTAAALLRSLDPHAAAEVLRVAPPATAAGLVGELDADEAAELLRVLPDDEREELLRATDAPRAGVIRGLLAWPADSAAARMDPDVPTVRPTMTVRAAIEALRAQPEASGRSGEVYVTGAPARGSDPELLGVVAFRDLVLASPDLLVAELVRDVAVTVEPTADRETAARLVRAHRLAALPVVDRGRLLGVLTPDDVAEITEQEATEDAERQGGAEPLDVPYLRASPLLLWRKRIVWMLALFVAEMYTGTVLRAFEDELSTVIALSFFVPLLIGTGGNTGTQVTTTLIRAMAVGQVRLRDVGRVVRKEVTTGAMTAVTIATVGWLRAWTLGVGSEVAVTVAAAAGAIVLWSSLVASVLPLVLRRIGVDPAVVSGPMITTLVDGTGLILYFEVAKLLIPSLGA